MNFISTEIFGFTITICIFFLVSRALKNVKNPLLNPLLISAIVIMLINYVLKIPYEQYNAGGSILTFFIAPATVALGLPLYRKRDLLKKYKFEILISIIVGTCVGLGSVYGLSKLFGLTEETLLSLLPKQTTTAIGAEVSLQIGGLVPLTIASIIVAGTTGVVTKEFIQKALKIQTDEAMGLALGTGSHVFGTNKAMEHSEVAGAMASLATCLCGLLTAIILSIIY